MAQVNELEELAESCNFHKQLYGESYEKVMKLLSTPMGKSTGTIWGTDNPRGKIEHERDFSKMNVFCEISAKILGPIFFEGATGLQYLEMLENWLFPQLEEEAQQFTFQQDRAPKH
ncbi:hypothetical protein J6590_008371 [Homalodisca vitripennis]|nr:hypothetical protein J6590_008371 [Homalodisca vitripennis]